VKINIILLLVLLAVCSSACNQENTNAESEEDVQQAYSTESEEGALQDYSTESEEGALQEYNAEEALRKLESDPYFQGPRGPANLRDIYKTPWDSPPEALRYPPVPDLSKIGLEDFEGSVGLWLTISVEGFVDTAWVIRSSGHAELDSLALDALQNIVFTPAKKNGTSIEISFPIPMHFSPN